ncbi:MAG: type III glutamate--ammonia ligase [Chloroflexota bacterium]|nr:type III glutamate--ammonia ligase [Chloroflexota bacterium]
MTDAQRAFEKRVGADNLRGLWIVWHDYAARANGRWLPGTSIPAALANGTLFCHANLDFTTDDQQVAQPRFGADAGDFVALPDPETYAPLPYHPGIGRVLSDLRTEAGEPWEGCPRTRLRDMLDALAQRDLSARAAFEPEFTLLRKANDGSYAPADAFTMYSVARMEAEHDLLDEIETTLAAQNVRVVGMGAEYGAGQLEINLHHEHPVKAADDLLTFRETVKALARRRGLIASFMPKPYEHLAGNGVHVHLSLWDADGSKDRSAGDGPLGLSAEMARFIAGVLAHAPALCGVFAPTVNSYKRLLPGSWAPAHIGYSAGNRAALVRVPGASRPRLEFRAGDHTAHPHLALAALIAAGMDGLDRHLDPGLPATGDLGHLSANDLAAQGVHLLPRTAHEALDAIEADSVVMAALGPVCGPELLRIRREELARYDLHVSDWERAVYLERV